MRVVAATSFWCEQLRRYVRSGEVFDDADPIVAGTPPVWWRPEVVEQATAAPGELRHVPRPKATS